MRDRASPVLRWQSMPRMRARPALGLRNPRSVWISVDLPAPFGPSRPMAFPVPETPRRQEIPCRISRRPSLTFRFSISTTAVSKLLSGSYRRLAEGLQRHEIQHQPGYTSTAGRVDLFRCPVEYNKNGVARGQKVAKRRLLNERR